MTGKDIKCERDEEVNVCGKLCEATCNNPYSNSELCPPIVSPRGLNYPVVVLKLNSRINFSRATGKLRGIVDAGTAL